MLANIETLLAPVAAAQGLELYHVEWLQEHGKSILRLYIDKEGGISLNDCEGMSRAADPVLDAADPIPQAYSLQVSSPGLDRQLVKDSHFLRHLSQVVEVKLSKPLAGHENNRKKFQGILTALEGGTVLVTNQDPPQETWCFTREHITSCRLRPSFTKQEETQP